MICAKGICVLAKVWTPLLGGSCSERCDLQKKYLVVSLSGAVEGVILAVQMLATLKLEGSRERWQHRTT